MTKNSKAVKCRARLACRRFTGFLFFGVPRVHRSILRGLKRWRLGFMPVAQSAAPHFSRLTYQMQFY